MANLTDPLIRAIQGTDPQNLMEYITRQKIYDSRFWKEECFGLSAADVLEKAAKSIKCIGGTFGANQMPTKFLCLALKLLQLQPEDELIRTAFLKQDHFKYAKVLGAFYLRLTGRPADIYEGLEPLYADYSKLKVRMQNEWKLVYVDEFVHDLLTQPFSCGIALPRLPARETLEQEGYLEDGPRVTALKEVLEEAGGLEEYLKYKVEIEQSPAAIALWEKRSGNSFKKPVKGDQSRDNFVVEELSPSVLGASHLPQENELGEIEEPTSQTKTTSKAGLEQKQSKKRKLGTEQTTKDKKKKPKYGSLFKKERQRDGTPTPGGNASGGPVEGSDEYWNQERAKLGLKPLKKT